MPYKTEKSMAEEYAIVIHDRQTEDDPNLGTVIYSRNNTYWHEMATGPLDFCNEIIDALYAKRRMDENDYERQIWILESKIEELEALLSNKSS